MYLASISCFMSVNIISYVPPFFIMSTSAQSNTAKVDLYGQVCTLNTNILASPISATIQPNSVWLIYVISTIPCTLTCYHTQISTNNVYPEVFSLKGMNQSDFFNTLITVSETINFQTSANTTLQRFNVSEIVPLTSAQGA